jgi:hypothetical protein
MGWDALRLKSMPLGRRSKFSGMVRDLKANRFRFEISLLAYKLYR